MTATCHKSSVKQKGKQLKGERSWSGEKLIKTVFKNFIVAACENGQAYTITMTTRSQPVLGKPPQPLTNSASRTQPKFKSHVWTPAKSHTRARKQTNRWAEKAVRASPALCWPAKPSAAVIRRAQREVHSEALAGTDCLRWAALEP